ACGWYRERTDGPGQGGSDQGSNIGQLTDVLRCNLQHDFHASGTGQCVTLPGPREQARTVPALSRTSAQAATSQPMNRWYRPDQLHRCRLLSSGPGTPSILRKKGADDATQVHAGSPDRRDTR